MKRFRIPVFLGLLICFLVASFPLRVVVAGTGLLPDGVQFSGAQGTVWSGTLRDVTWRGLRLGDMRLALKPSGFLRGAATVRFESFGGAMSLKGVVSKGALGETRLRGVTISGASQALPVQHFLVSGLHGSYRLDLRALDLQDGRCRKAEGDVWTDTLALGHDRWQGKGPVLAGPVECKEGNISIHVGGTEGPMTITSQSTIDPRGGFDIAIDGKGVDQGMMAALQALGFERTGDGFAGHFKGQF